MSELRDGLVYSLDHESQVEALNKLGNMETPQSVSILCEALKGPQITVKSEIMTLLSHINKEYVYDTLLEVIDESADTVKWQIQQAFSQAELSGKYLEKIEKFRKDFSQAQLLAQIIRFLGKLGDQALLEPLGQVIFTNQDTVRMGVIDALEYLDNKACLNYLMTAVKMFSPEVARRALKVIEKFKDKNAILPLLYALGEASGEVTYDVARVLKDFDQKEILGIIQNNLSSDDTPLINSSILYLELTGKIDIARKIRERYRVSTEIQQADGSDAVAKTTLEFEVKHIGEMVLIGLKGILDLYTLPRLKRVTEAVVTHGYNKVLLLCEQIEKLDRSASVYLNTLDAKLKKMMGGLKFIKLECMTDQELKHSLPKVDVYPDLPTAASSFSVVRSDKLVKVNDAMLEKSSKIEVTYTTGGKDKSRTTEVLSMDDRRVTLSWEVVDKEDVFREYANDNVHLTFVRNNDVMNAQTRVFEQIHFPDQAVIIIRPRMAHVVERRREIRINTRFPMRFLQVKNLREIMKSQLPAICLNISAGGMMLLTPLKLAEGSIIILCFPPGELKMGKVLGKIARRNERVERGKLLFEYGVIFAKIMDADRMKIKKYVFDKISRRRGLSRIPLKIVAY